jgi:hypothetical protein
MSQNISYPILSLFSIEGLIVFSQYYGKPVWHLVMAIEDVGKGEFERIKEFGIRIKLTEKGYTASYKGEERHDLLPFFLIQYLKSIIK